jgi:hypothetical protein
MWQPCFRLVTKAMMLAKCGWKPKHDAQNEIVRHLNFEDMGTSNLQVLTDDLVLLC